MLKNTEGKEVDAFEQAIEYRLTNLDKDIAETEFSSNALYSDGMVAGYRYALAIYRECRKDGTI